MVDQGIVDGGRWRGPTEKGADALFGGETIPLLNPWLDVLFATTFSLLGDVLSLEM